jgi:hypothetical protein
MTLEIRCEHWVFVFVPCCEVTSKLPITEKKKVWGPGDVLTPLYEPMHNIAMICFGLLRGLAFISRAVSDM